MKVKRGLFVVVLLVLFLMLVSGVAFGAEYGDDSWANFVFDKHNDKTVFGGEPLPVTLDWDIDLDYEHFKAQILGLYSAGIFKEDNVIKDTPEFWADSRGSSTNVFRPANYADTHIFITWVYVELEDEEPDYVKEVNVERHDDDLNVYVFNCGEDFECQDEIVYTSQHPQNDVTILFSLVRGWNVVVMVLDDDEGTAQRIYFEDSGDLLSTDSNILFMGSRWELADEDKDGVLDAKDKCLGTPEDETPVKIEESEVNGCSVSQKEADDFKDICDTIQGAWLGEAEDGNNCCGNEGIDEIGTLEYSEEALGNNICLNTDEEWVGREGDFPEDANCNDDDIVDGWCWVHASSDADFNIFTIKKPGEVIYDVVSNNEEWFKCNEEGTQDISLNLIHFENVPRANNFYCYQEGNRWSWAECYEDPELKNGVKNRKPGEGLFSLPVEVEPEGKYATIDIENGFENGFENYYGENAYVSFSGYDYFNFMVKFREISGWPSEVVLEIFGPDNVKYYEGNVLGHAVNQPLLKEDNWIHVAVPVSDWRGVKQINIRGDPVANLIDVKNVYLSRKTEDSLICSGKSSVDKEQSAWLDNLDFWEAGNPVSGEDVCNEIYDPEFIDDPEYKGKAWLGEEVADDKKRCCGNNHDEYYSGDSKSVEGKKYACWNSQVIGEGDTTMNVEFGVKYFEQQVGEIDYSTHFTYSIISFYGNEDLWEDNWRESFSGGVDIIFGEEYMKDVSEMEIEPTIEGTLVEPIFGMVIDGTIPLSGLKIISGLEEIYFLNKVTGEPKSKELNSEDIKAGLDVFVVIAETDKVTVTEGTQVQQTKTINYACAGSEGECVYPLPGVSPYVITNLHPELYELWFVSEEGDDVLIDSTLEFNVPGNLRAKKVSQQVIFDVEKDEDEEVIDTRFYGCQAADFIEGLGGLENELFCSIKGGKFCSPQEGYLINSWSGELLTRWGYQEEESEEYDFALVEDGSEEANKRNQSTSTVPGRNFLPNAEFTEYINHDDLVGWRIFDNTDKVVENEKDYLRENLADGILTIKPRFELKSEKIAMPQEQNVLVSFEGGCQINSKFYNKDGVETVLPGVITSLGTQYSTGESPVFLTLEFSGGGEFCEVSQPMLQVIDDLDPLDYSYDVSEPERTGAACCQAEACWNGYVCVKDMSDLTYMAEKVDEDRLYRCIKGEWKYMPQQWDWNFVEDGFCSSKEQCFVMKSNDLPIADTPEGFYEGNNPGCIDTGEFIFDHYCEEGTWTSRTKFLAASLLGIDKGDNFVLYCSDPFSALVELTENDKGYLGIEETVPSDDIFGPQGGEYTGNCFDGPLPEGLVTSEENICANNFCVLRFEDGGELKTAFATSLNNDEFLESLQIPMGSLEEICPAAEDEELVECDLDSIDLDGQLWYLPELNSIIYGEEGVDLGSGVVGSIIDWFADLFGIELEDAGFVSFIEDATTFRELYLLSKDGKSVKAMREIFPKKETLVAEYEGFETPICDYVESIEVPPEAQEELLEGESGIHKMDCEVLEEGTTKVAVVAGLDFFWPQLTGKLRVGE
ncbi:hypothetical protein GOV03_02785 [Candidatus Woesearchaeota archaeon]|nr:hypothetical protein [Candidatus Woesearchaeota archaeon]